MALQKSFEKLKNDCFKRIASGQTIVSTRVPAQVGKITKVLSVSALAQVLGCEAFSGEAKISGRVDFKVLYVDDAGDNRCAEGGVDFSEKLSSPEIVPALILHPSSTVIDVDTALVTGEEVKLSGVIELILAAVIKEDLEYLKNGGDDLYIQSEVLKTQEQSGSFHGDVELTEEFKVGKAARKIMLADASAIVTKSVCGERSVVVDGKVSLTIVTENEGGTLESVFKLIPFSQEIGAPDVFSTDFAHAHAFVTKCDLVLNIEEDGVSVDSALTVGISGTAFREGEVEVITDAFSVSFETKTTTQSVELTRAVFTQSFEAKIEGTAALETEMPSVDKVITALAPRINIANVYAEDDKVVVEGVLTASVLYYNSELNNLNSVQVELPYSQSLNASGASSAHRLTAVGMPVSVSSRVRKINEVEVFAEVMFVVTADSSEIYHAVTDVECGAERAPGAAVAIYITKSQESLWDVAKSLITTPELILAQNPTLKLPLQGGERVLVYHQLRAKL